MSDTAAVPSPPQPVLSSELKATMLAAADAHLSAITADVSKLKAAISGDLAGIGSAGQSAFDRLESRVVGELASLRADLAGQPLRRYALAIGLAVAGAVATVGHFIAHLF